MGASRTFRINKSNELGHAFCRWFLSEHLGIPYVAHLDHVLDQSENELLGGISVEKNPSVQGDAPDYVCVDLVGAVTLAEAKGTSQTASFKSKKFDGWRKQFERLTIKDPSGVPMIVKGQIIATRWAFEGQRKSTKLFAEDPATIGEKLFEDRGRKLTSAVKSIHYASSLQKLGHELLASALVDGFQIPKEYEVGCYVWESHLPSLNGLRFVGGYFGGGWPLGTRKLSDGSFFPEIWDPLSLSRRRETFFGIEESTFKILTLSARQGSELINELSSIEKRETGMNGTSLLKDGHILGPLESFYPVERTIF